MLGPVNTEARFSQISEIDNKPGNIYDMANDMTMIQKHSDYERIISVPSLFSRLSSVFSRLQNPVL